MSESLFLKRKNERLFSYIFVYQKNHPIIVLVQLYAKAKLLATLNMEIVKRITYEVLWKFLENFENISFIVSFIRSVRRFSKMNK